MTAATSTSNLYRLPLYAIASAAFAILFLYHINPIPLGDLYWHLNTGQWIWDHGALPDTDPFTYTLADTPDTRQHMILHGYWLAQLLYFGFYSAFGPWGLVILKAALLVSLYFLVWRAMVKAGVEPLLGLLAILMLPWLLYRYDELRPQLFSFIGMVLVYLNMHDVIEKLRSETIRPGALIALPIIMLLWANLHPGYILGWVVILVMLAGAVFEHLRHNHVLSRPTLQRLLIWCGIALLTSLVNPLTGTLISNIGMLQDPSLLQIDEFLPLYSYAHLYHQPLLFYSVLAIALASMGVLIRCRRQVDPAQTVMFIGFAAAGFYSFRYMIFFVLIALMITMPHASKLFGRFFDRFRSLLLALMLTLMAGIGYQTFQHGTWKLGQIESSYVPERTADWILDQRPPAPLFNAYEYGGYLGWRLYPEYQMFIDPRNLDFGVHNAYQTARGGSYGGVFGKYGVNTIIFYLITPGVNSIPGVTLYLLMDQRWDLVFVDRLTVVLVRHKLNTLPVIDKAPLLDYLQRVLEQTLAETPDDTQSMVQYGIILLYRGNISGAQQQFNAALQINPELGAARHYLDKIKRNQP